ncbi:MAG TPA: hypothetical protein PLV25_07600 [Opitutales bacterium]|nr:hypothetical protein [Opitutales bacterium]
MMKLHHPEWKVCLEHQANFNYQIIRGYWVGAFQDPLAFLEIWTTFAANNLTGWSNAQYDAYIEEASQIIAPDQRLALLAKAEGLLLAQAPVIPVFWYTRTYLMDPRVQGWQAHLTDVRPLKQVHF